MLAAAAALLLWAPWAAPARSEGSPAGLAVGSSMADFGLRRLDIATGRLTAMVWLSDFVGDAARSPRKRLLLLNFFAAWCQPCLEELPLLGELQAKHAGDGLQVVSVYQRRDGESLQDAVAQMRQRLAGRSPPFPLLFDRYTNRNQQLYLGSRAVLPCNVLIGGDGRILARFQGGRAAKDGALASEVVRLLGGAQ